MSANLTKREIIRDDESIRMLMQVAPRVWRKYMGIKFRKNLRPYCRVIVFVRRGDKKSRAIVRNRLRRIGREMFRQQKANLSVPYGDIAITMSESALDVPHNKRSRLFVELVQQAARKGNRG